MRRDGGFIAEIIHSFGMPESIVYALLVETVENELQQIFRQTFKLYRYHNRIQDGCYIVPEQNTIPSYFALQPNGP